LEKSRYDQTDMPQGPANDLRESFNGAAKSVSKEWI
jgi:hypothetical protein